MKKNGVKGAILFVIIGFLDIWQSLGFRMVLSVHGKGYALEMLGEILSGAGWILGLTSLGTGVLYYIESIKGRVEQGSKNAMGYAVMRIAYTVLWLLMLL